MKFLTLVVLLLIAGCQTGKKTATTSVGFVKTDGGKEINANQLTDGGENYEAYYDKNGESIVFLSRLRPAHLQPQVYMKDLKTGAERRLTFHDGEDSCPWFLPDGKSIIYSSTTDEIKEGDELFRAALKSVNHIGSEKKSEDVPRTTEDHIKMMKGDLPPFEIYMSAINGSEISRLTKNSGYDSEGSGHPDGKTAVFSSSRSGDVELYELDLRRNRAKRLTFAKGADGGAFYSPDGKNLLWRRFDEKSATSQLFIGDQKGRKPRQITTKKAHHWSPFWHPNGEWVVFASNRGEAQRFDIYVADTKGTCLKRITDGGGNNFSPAFHPTGEKILFTSDRTGNLQIYEVPYLPTSTCLPEPP